MPQCDSAIADYSDRLLARLDNAILYRDSRLLAAVASTKSVCGVSLRRRCRGWVDLYFAIDCETIRWGLRFGSLQAAAPERLIGSGANKPRRRIANDKFNVDDFTFFT